jgi:hypothetical protein
MGEGSLEVDMVADVDGVELDLIDWLELKLRLMFSSE